MSALAARGSSIREYDAVAAGPEPAAAVAPFRYRAFLSYSHRDSQWVGRLHKALETYRLDKDLVGRQTAHGIVPKTLRPIIRDREDFSAGHSLTEQTLAALQSSQFLIVVCSPNAARSQYVDQEIRYFKSLDRGACVINVIIAGEPGDPEQECFPPAVRDRIGADGQPTGEHEEPIAADARPQGDGERVARLKIVAGLLGVGFDEIAQRAKRARKRRNRVRAGFAVAIFAMIGAAVLGWRGVHLVHMQLLDAQDLNDARETADLCESGSKSNRPAAWHVTLAIKCVETFDLMLGELPRNTSLPQRVVSLFETNLAKMRKLGVERKLTPQQFQLLHRAEINLQRFGRPLP